MWNRFWGHVFLPNISDSFLDKNVIAKRENEVKFRKQLKLAWLCSKNGFWNVQLQGLATHWDIEISEIMHTPQSVSLKQTKVPPLTK